MDRDDEVEFTLSDGTYVVKLLQGVQIEQQDSSTIGRWPAFDLEAKGDSEAEVCQRLVDDLRHRAGGDPDAPEFQSLGAYVREHGTRQADQETTARDLAQEADKQAYPIARDKLTAITPDDISAESSTGVPLLVDFWAEWCGPCRMVAPVLAELSEQWAGRIVVCKINVDQFEAVWERFNFRAIPAMLMFKGGREVHRVIGFGGKRQLMAELEPHLA